MSVVKLNGNVISRHIPDGEYGKMFPFYLKKSHFKFGGVDFMTYRSKPFSRKTLKISKSGTADRYLVDYGDNFVKKDWSIDSKGPTNKWYTILTHKQTNCVGADWYLSFALDYSNLYDDETNAQAVIQYSYDNSSWVDMYHKSFNLHNPGPHTAEGHEFFGHARTVYFRVKAYSGTYWHSSDYDREGYGLSVGTSFQSAYIK